MITNHPPTPLSAQDAATLRSVFETAGYSEDNLRERSGLLVPPPREWIPDSVRTALTQGEGAFESLAEMFYLGLPCASSKAKSLPAAFLDICVDNGLLARVDDFYVPRALVVPVQTCFFASDLQLVASQDEEHYVPTTCDAALHLNATAIRRPVKRVLDLCSGFSMHGVLASRFAEQVVATDLNPRAEYFARFNASLNGCNNLSAVTGNLLDAVQGQRFDLILCNPPFIISPDAVTTFRFSQFELDGFVQTLFGQTPGFLEEGGILQAICEWVEFEEGDWQDRLATWFKSSGCGRLGVARQ